MRLSPGPVYDTSLRHVPAIQLRYVKLLRFMPLIPRLTILAERTHLAFSEEIFIALFPFKAAVCLAEY